MIIGEKDTSDMEQEKDDDDQSKINDKTPKNQSKNDFKIIEYLEAEIIKIKDFVSIVVRECFPKELMKQDKK